MKNKILLGTKSPRRQEIMKMAGFDFQIIDINFEEKIPTEKMAAEDIPMLLANQKAMHGKKQIGDGDILLTADTLVFLDDKILGKPKDRNHALEILQQLSGKKHTVITGVCLMTSDKKITFYDETHVYFKNLDMKELEYYIDTWKPMDKAGAYGVQDWIGTIGVDKIEGNFYNVMGLPVHKVYDCLKSFSETGEFTYKPWKT